MRSETFKKFPYNANCLLVSIKKKIKILLSKFKYLFKFILSKPYSKISSWLKETFRPFDVYLLAPVQLSICPRLFEAEKSFKNWKMPLLTTLHSEKIFKTLNALWEKSMPWMNLQTKKLVERCNGRSVFNVTNRQTSWSIGLF